MSSVPIEISSDEEAGPPEEESVDWLSNLIGDDGGDSDDVVVIGEVNSKSTKLIDVDDDCVVLDGDPDNPVDVVGDVSGSGSDELVVIGEKGQIACRDYPHPRHLCAKFPFNSTSHETHCELCHCYVCDSLAPCVHWGSGASTTEHCHATEKVELWKIMRRNYKMMKSASFPVSKASLAQPHLNHAPPCKIRLSPIYVPQNQVARPATTHTTCSSAGHALPAPSSVQPINHVSVPTLIRAAPMANLSRSRSHPSGFPWSKNGTQRSPVSQMHSNGVRTYRAPSIGNASLHYTSSPTMFKRPGSQPNNRSAYGLSNASNCANPPQYGLLNNSGCGHLSQHGLSNNSTCANSPQYGRIPTPMAAFNDNTLPFGWQDVNSSLHQNPSLPVGSTIVEGALPLPPQIYSEPIPHGQNLNQQGNQSNNQCGIQSQNASQNVCLQGNEGASAAVDLGFSDCNYSWMNNSGQSIQQPPVEISQIQSTESVCGPPPVTEPDFQSNVYSNINGLESEFDSWLLDNQPGPPVTNESMPSQLHLLSPEPTLADAGMLLFDFETSFNGLTQV